MLIKSSKANIYLILIIILGGILRFSYLELQSPWLDEIITLRVTSEESSFTDIWLRMSNGNQHLPLYYFSLHAIFSIIGESIFYARFFSAIIGVLGILGIYILSKEFFPKKFALIPTLFTAINSHHILYSQEARMYSLLFLSSVVSMIFLVRLIKTHSNKNSILYGLTLALFLNIHIFSLFTVLAQGIILLLTIISNKDKQLFYKGLIAGLIALLFSLPMFIALSNISETNASWIPAPTINVFNDLISSFFGNSDMLLTLIVLFSAFGIYELNKNTKGNSKKIGNIKKGTVLILWLLIPFLTALIVSFVKTPVIEPRYFTSILPPVILIFSYGIFSLKKDSFKIMSIVFFIILSFTTLLFKNNYYNNIYKTQFRECAKYISLKDDKSLIVSNLSWYIEYFLDKEKFNVTQNTIDQYTKDLQNYNKTQNEFWYFGAHGETYNPSQETIDFLNREYIIQDEIDLFDAYAKKFVHKSIYKPTLNISNVNFDEEASGEPIKFYIENFQSKNNYISLEAWCFLKNMDSTHSDIFLLLVKNDSINKTISLKKINRPDISNAFKKEHNVSYSGINLEKELKSLEKGNYQIYIAIENKGKTGVVKTKKIVTIL